MDGTRNQQQGAALVVALMVVAIVSVLVTTVANDSLVTFRRVENQLHSQQAYAYLLAAEGVARRALLEDLMIDRKTRYIDSDIEQWAVTGLEFATEHGVISGQLSDLTGRLNIGTLGHRETKNNSYSLDQQRFVRLLQALPLEEPLDLNSAEELANAVFDWIDEDDRVRNPGGAESYYYASAEPAGRPANRAAVSVSELRWVKGMTAEIFKTLQPHICALPAAQGAINLNTASLEVLRSLNTDKDLQPLVKEDAESILAWRQKEGALSDFSLFTGQELVTRNIDTRGLSFKSEYFQLTAHTEFLSREFRLASILHRSAAKGTVQVVARSQAAL